MTQAEYINKFTDLTDQMVTITKNKNSDYSGGNAGAFRNFEMIEKVRSNISAADGIYIRMTDKFTRIGNLMERPAMVADEKIQDTLLDLANYALIMIILLSEKGEVKRNVLPEG